MTKARAQREPTVVGAFDAKTHLSKLLDRVERGEVITITRKGVPVARLAPVAHEGPGRSADEILAQFVAFQKEHPLRGITTRELVNAGRKR